MCEQFGDKIIVRINTSHASDRCKQNNIAYHFECLYRNYYSHINYLWLVQSDEIYDDNQIEEFKTWINGLDYKENTGYITTPICYFNSPHWAISPNEDFKRLTFINVNSLNNLLDYESIKLIKSPITFHHMSYVMSQQELTDKFENWGHRNDISLDRLTQFLTKFDKAKIDKTVKYLHPIIPNTYDHLEFRNDEINRECFLKYLLSNNNIKINSDVNNFLHEEDQILFHNIINEFLPLNPKILIIDQSQKSIFSSYISTCKTPIDITTIVKYNEKSLFEYNQGVKDSFEHKYKLYVGNHKTISVFPNNEFDLILFHIDDFSIFKQCFIEAWPKIKNYGIVLGTYVPINTDYNNYLVNTLSKHIERCPWGDTQFDYYENYLNLPFSNIHYKMWFVRVKK